MPMTFLSLILVFRARLSGYKTCSYNGRYLCHVKKVLC